MARSMQAMRLLSLVMAIVLEVQISLIPGASAQGSWQLLVQNAGIASMHTAITHYNTAIMFDRTETGPSNISLPNGQCRVNVAENTDRDCTAHSVMMDTKTNTVRALSVQTDTWCSSGQFFSDGTMVQTGGYKDGSKKIRRLTPCQASGTCNWVEDETVALKDARWYASNQLLPDGQRQIVVGGAGSPSYEFVPKRSATEASFPLQLLTDTLTSTHGEYNNLYPFVHLLPNGNLFIFANRDSILLDYTTNTVVKTFPTIPGEPRNYPSAGSSVLLPLDHATGFATAEVLVCGGGELGAYSDNRHGLTWPASQTCGRMDVTAAAPAWVMETMPMRRNMGDMVLLPTGDVLIINGAGKGSQGWGQASDAVLTPVTYATNNALARFNTMAPTTIPRVYHSTANLLADGRILVAGSNTYHYYTFTGPFPTELRVEAYSPAYLAASLNPIRPTNVFAPRTIRYGRTFTVSFTIAKAKGALEVNLRSSPFVTHSYSMGQRMLKLQATTPVASKDGIYSVVATAPPNNQVAPSSYYMLFAVQDGVPSQAIWVQLR